MMRLIDADALKEKAYSVTVKNEWHMHTSIDVVDMEDIDTEPTIDAVPVVRCKDCVFGMADDSYSPSLYLCQHRWDDWNNWNRGNHYCSYGERKDNE